MLRSMTGYGQGEAVFGEKKVIAEVRSVNHRFLDVSVRLPRVLLSLENDIKKLVSNHCFRGKVDVYILLEPTQGGDSNIHVNKAMVTRVCDLLRQIQNDAGIPGDINIATLLPFKDIIFEEEQEEIDLENYWGFIQPSIEQALQSMNEMQQAEGEEITIDLKQRLEDVDKLTGEIEGQAAESTTARRNGLKERVKSLCDGIVADEGRLLQEIAIMADRSDITEELVRTKSHVKQLKQWMAFQEAPAGRKLEFLIQEINREVNTIGSKASDSEISLKVVLIKNELEKIREQAQNVM